jgi:hypothetical protein
VAYDFRCVAVNDYPVADLDVDVSLDSYQWLQESFKKAEHKPQFTFTYDSTLGVAAPSSTGSPATQTVPTPVTAPAPLPRLKLTLQQDPGTPYTLFRLNFGVSVKTLRPNIRQLTTEDDSQPGEAEKTYRFFEFISALATVHLQDKATIRLPSPVFVTLKNK